MPPGQRVDRYQAKIESSFTLFFHFYGGDPGGYVDGGWVAIDKSGVRYFFGPDAETRESPASVGPADRIGRWLLKSIVDTNGNILTVDYDGKTLSRISYQDVRIDFEMGSVTDPDGRLAFYPTFREDYEGRFEAYQVLTSIQILQGGSRLQRLALTYDITGLRRARYLKSIQQFGRTDAESLPPVTFNYHDEGELSFSPRFTRQAGRSGFSGMMNESATFADMNGDGLVDQIVANDDGSFEVYFNDGNDFVAIPGRSHWPDPFACGGGLAGDPNCRGKLNASRTGDDGDSHQWLFLMDMNGDNLPDRVGRVLIANRGQPDETANFRIAFNNGHGWDAPDPPVEWRDPYQGSWAGTSDQDKGFVDMNGDGLIDRVVGDHDVGLFKVYYNTGAGFKQSPENWTDPLTKFPDYRDKYGRMFAYDDDKLFLTIRDMNGDGLPDRIYKMDLVSEDGSRRVGFGVSLNTGRAWGQPRPAPDGSPYDAVFEGFDTIAFADPAQDEGSRGYIDKQHDLVDVNGDGFLDRVEGNHDTCDLRFSLYRGMTSLESFSQLSFPIVIHDPIQDRAAMSTMEACGYLSNTYENSSFVFFQDFNGDGLPDRLAVRWGVLGDVSRNTYDFHSLRLDSVQFSDSPSWWSDSEVNQPLGALKEVVDSQGANIAIEYQPTTWPQEREAPNHRFLPFNLNVVRNIYGQDPSLSPASGPFTSLPEVGRHPGMRWTTYLFHGGNFFVRNAVKDTDDPADDRVSRVHYARFNGFQQVTKMAAHGPFETWNPYSTTTYFHQALGDVDPLPDGLRTGFDASGYAHYALSGKPYLQSVKEGDREVVRQENVWYANDAGGSNFDCGPGLCYPRQTSVVKTVHEDGEAVPRVSRVNFEYDDQGNVTAERHDNGLGERMISTETTYFAATDFEGRQIRDRPQSQRKLGADGSVLRKKEFIYDDRGNPTRETFFVTADGAETLVIHREFNDNGTLARITDTDGVSKTIWYDADGLFPTSETVLTPSGTWLTTTRTFDRLTGEIAQERNPQGVGKRIVRDGFGRPIEEYLLSADGTATRTRLHQYEYQPVTLNGWDSVVLLLTRTYEPQPGYPATETTPAEITYGDGSGQILQKCILSERGNYRLAQSRVRNGGREVLQTEPAFASDCAFLPFPWASARLLRKTKDLMGRDVRIEPPPGDAASPVGPTTIAYANDAQGRLVKTTTDSRGRATVEIYDPFERLRESVVVLTKRP